MKSLVKKLIGETEENVIVLEFDTERGRFSISGVEYDGSDYLFTEEEGESRARDYLEDGELWRMCVEAGNTTAGLDEWVDDVLNFDGWMETLGDIEDIDIYDPETGDYVKTLYSGWGSCGQINMSLSPEDIISPLIHMPNIELIFKYWSEYHLKDLSEIPDEVITNMTRIFTPETDLSDWRPDLSGLDPKDEDD